MCSESSNFVAETFRCNNGNFITNLLVGLKVQSQTRVIFFNDNSGCSLDGFGANSSLKVKNGKKLESAVNGS